MVLTRTAAGHSGIALIRFVGERVFDWKARRAGRGLAESSGKRRIQVPTLGHASLGGALLTLATASLLVITGATAGSLQIRFASEVAASNAVIKAGSNLVATKVG